MRMHHEIPKDDIGPHIEEIYCECEPYIDETDVMTVIHQRFEYLHE